MTIDGIRTLWAATTPLWSPDYQTQILWQLLRDHTNLDCDVVARSLGPGDHRQTLWTLVEQNADPTLVMASLRRLRGEDASRELCYDFFTQSLTMAAAQSPLLTEVGLLDGELQVPPEGFPLLPNQPEDNVLLGGLRVTLDGMILVLAVYSSRGGTYVDPFVVIPEGKRKLISLPPRAELAGSYAFPDVGTFVVPAPAV